jgi:AcrR family transcriptional regulator
VLDLVGDGATLSSLSFVTIAHHAGVSRNSMYRRWQSKERLFIDVVKSVDRGKPDRSEHSAREQLVKVLDPYVERATDPRVFRMEQVIEAEALNFPDLFDYYIHSLVAPLSIALKMAIRGGKETGEIRVDVDEGVLVAVLVSSVRARAGSSAQVLVDFVFDGVSPR